ncbi:MAG: (Fe-S)-binding protein [Chloroflexota bacterium]|nr:(Fe-S)-binding protein [Chloroflexota bacterium]
MGTKVLDLTTLDRTLARQVTPEWEQLLSCIQCGTCSASCPTAFAMDYTPRQLWQMVRLGMKEDVLSSRTFWLCTTCKSCQVRCPRGIPITDTMIALKEYAMRVDINVPEGMKMFGETVATGYNISGDDNENRQIWSQNLDHLPRGVEPRRKKAEVLYFIGCVSSFYPRAYSIPQALVQIMEQADVEFTTLGGDEWCCGYPLHIAGMGDRMRELAQHNVQKAREVGVKKVVFTCPSCYYAWEHLYPEVVNTSGIQLQHASEFMAELLAGEYGRGYRTPVLGPVEEVVTYHDPCDLGRKSGVYDAPREVLARIPGLEFREMSASRENALCCGGGGDVEVADRSVPAGVAARRLTQVQATGSKYVLSACQQCKRTLQEGARQNKIRVRAMDLTELVWKSMRAAP